jgi:actin-related protein 3
MLLTLLFQTYDGANAVTGQPFKLEVGYERFLGPEILFKNELANAQCTTSLGEAVDEVIQKCPVDVRLQLYANIYLSGGSTMFENFGIRLQQDVKYAVDRRLGYPNRVDVQVLVGECQRYGAWFGSSVFASLPQIRINKVFHTKSEYDEHGSGLFRHSPWFPRVSAVDLRLQQ